MTKTSSRGFTYHTLYARDPARACVFYRDLLGWKIDEDGRCTNDGREIATISQSKAPPHVPSYWLPFLGSTDVDAKTEKARAIGAQVRRHAPGLEAVIVDPRGAVVGLRAAGEITSVFAWNELLTDEPGVAADFYAALGGFAIDTIDLGSAAMYWILRNGAISVAGVMKHPANLHPHWQSYLAVDDVDAITARALKLGATPYFAPRDQSGFGRWSAIDDPVGAGICFLRRATA
jgi:predicted enzyme related to lactoylglutathione lyase